MARRTLSQVLPKQLLRAEYSSGLTQRAIAQKYGFSHPAVQNLMAKYGIARRLPRPPFPKTHGHAIRHKPSKEYRTWQSMKSRCYYQKHKGYEYYGLRGITVCERWMKFENFLADMGRKPARMTLERIDNDGNYEPSNCCWATQADQNRNRRRLSR